MTQEVAVRPDKYSFIRLHLFQLFLQLEKATFWRLPSSLQKKKRAALMECTEMFTSVYYSHPKEAASVRQSLAEPYILVGIAKAYMSMYCFPSSQGSSSGAVEGLPIQPGQKKSFGHYQSSKIFQSRFKKVDPLASAPKRAIQLSKSAPTETLSVPINESTTRFQVSSLWTHPNEITLSMDGYSAVGEPGSKKAFHCFHLKVQHSSHSWKVAKTYKAFEALEENVRKGLAM